MKKSTISFMLLGISLLISISLSDTNAYARENTITQGISIEDMDISGMSVEEANQAVMDYVNQYTSKIFTLDVDGHKVEVTAGELGYYWKNTEIINDAASYCKEGNVISRYKEAKDIEKNGKNYDIELTVNDEIMTDTINEKCGIYNIPHKNAVLKKVGSGFEITKESSGRMIDMDKTIGDLSEYLLNKWDGKDDEFTLTVVDDEPTSRVEDCEKVKDLIGTYTTSFSTGGNNYNRNKNMENGIVHLDGITLSMGETMSVNSYLEPWTADNGWYMAGTYVNGRVENSLGGGICQVSSTLYNALLLAEIEIVERFPHSMSVGYVPLSQDAALAGTWKDLKVRNNTDTPIYIEGIYTAGKITFNIYGVETRPSNRKIEYKSETISTIPSQEVVKQDPTLPTGYRAVTGSGHTGYKTKLLKRVYIDGELKSEEVVNTSTYAASPTYVTEGTGPAAPAVPEQPSEEPTTTGQPSSDNGQNNKPSETTTVKPTETTTTEAVTEAKPTETTSGGNQQEPTEPAN